MTYSPTNTADKIQTYVSLLTKELDDKVSFFEKTSPLQQNYWLHCEKHKLRSLKQFSRQHLARHTQNSKKPHSWEDIIPEFQEPMILNKENASVLDMTNQIKKNEEVSQSCNGSKAS
jgi:hypothetical protein